TAELARRELLALARHYGGPHGLGTHHATPEPAGPGACDGAASPTADPARAAEWAELLEQAGRLPPPEREAFDLLWCQGLSQEEAAGVLGVCVRTIKRHWLSAKLHLAGILGRDLPS